MHAVGGKRAGELFVLSNTFAKLAALLSTGAVRAALTMLGWPAVLGGVALGYIGAGLLLLPRMGRVAAAAHVVAASGDDGRGAAGVPRVKGE